MHQLFLHHLLWMIVGYLQIRSVVFHTVLVNLIFVQRKVKSQFKTELSLRTRAYATINSVKHVFLMAR